MLILYQTMGLPMPPLPYLLLLRYTSIRKLDHYLHRGPWHHLVYAYQRPSPKSLPKVLFEPISIPIITYTHPGAHLRNLLSVEFITPSNQDYRFKPQKKQGGARGPGAANGIIFLFVNSRNSGTYHSARDMGRSLK